MKLQNNIPISWFIIAVIFSMQKVSHILDTYFQMHTWNLIIFLHVDTNTYIVIALRLAITFKLDINKYVALVFHFGMVPNAVLLCSEDT
jgi:hypothetical protein